MGPSSAGSLVSKIRSARHLAIHELACGWKGAVESELFFINKNDGIQGKRWETSGKGETKMGEKSFDTPLKFNMEPQNHSIEKENNLTKNSMTLDFQLFVFRGVQGGPITPFIGGK